MVLALEINFTLWGMISCLAMEAANLFQFLNWSSEIWIPSLLVISALEKQNRQAESDRLTALPRLDAGHAVCMSEQDNLTLSSWLRNETRLLSWMSTLPVNSGTAKDRRTAKRRRGTANWDGLWLPLRAKLNMRNCRSGSYSNHDLGKLAAFQ
jgi:hypothetical protein